MTMTAMSILFKGYVIADNKASNVSTLLVLKDGRLVSTAYSVDDAKTTINLLLALEECFDE